MSRMKKAGQRFADLIEIYIPVAVFVMLFLSFMLNIIFRYVIRNPQNWTFEFSVNAFVIVGLLGSCVAYRQEDHVVFDLLYTRLGAKGQNILRIISFIIVIIFFTLATPPSIRYLWKIRRSVTPIMEIPLWIIFTSFPILLISTVLRSASRLIADIKAFKKKTYVQTYNTEEGDMLI